jgi:hypothetical protein
MTRTARRPAARHDLRALRTVARQVGQSFRRIEIGTCGVCKSDTVRVDETGRLARHGSGCVGAGCRPMERSDDTLIAALQQLHALRARWVNVAARFDAEFNARPGTLGHEATRKVEAIDDLLAGAEATLASYRSRVARAAADHAKVADYRAKLVARFGSVEAATAGARAHLTKLEAGIAGDAARNAANKAAATRKANRQLALLAA